MLILKSEFIPIDSYLGALLNTESKARFAELERSDPFLKTEKLASHIRNGKGYKYAKIKYKLIHSLHNTITYSIAYVLSTDRQSFMITEWSRSEEDLEKYLWTIKEM